MAKLLTPSVVCISLLGFTGCAVVPTQSELAHGVVCPECKVVWVEQLDMDDPYMMATTHEQRMACPDCETAV